MVEHVRVGARAAAVPIAGLALTYVVAVLTPWGRALDSLSSYGRSGTRWSVQAADLMVLETITVATLVLALTALVVVSGLRGRWQLGLRSTAATLAAIGSAEVLKHILPRYNEWAGAWNLGHGGSFPSGHAVVVTSISLAVLSISTDRWRRRLVGPLVAGTAIVTTATVTVGWHRPSDVLGSLFLATAWHRALRAGEPADRRLRTMLPHPSRPARSIRSTPASSATPAVPTNPAVPAGPAFPASAVTRPIPLSRATRFDPTAATRPIPSSSRPRAAVAGRPQLVPIARTASWWAGACTLILGAALEGALTGASHGRPATLAYLGCLAVLLTAVLVTIAMGVRPVPMPSPAGSAVRRSAHS